MPALKVDVDPLDRVAAVAVDTPEYRPLGRGWVINPGGAVPLAWSEAPVVVIDEKVLADPSATVAALHWAWSEREPVVVELGVDSALFRVAESITGPVWQHTPLTQPWFDRLHFLVWNNNYDARGLSPIWWWAAKAASVDDGNKPLAPLADTGDVRLPDGTVAWVDGGPRRVWDRAELGLPVIQWETIELGSVALSPPARPPAANADVLAADQLEAVSHDRGPARIIAPAGSGKTRVLTERLRHLVVEREYERESVLAVAYNKQAQLEMETRTADFKPNVRTLNSLGLWVLARHRRSSPPVIEERETRRLVEALLPGRHPRRSNTDPIGPYLEALSLVRLGLRDPAKVESDRDDVDGLAELFPAYRQRLSERGVVDFDEQIYGAIEVVLSDGDFRRELQRSCRHLLVDEFQDLTPAHVLLIRLLSAPTFDVFGVGDDDQCIYGYASADPAFLIEYAELFPGAAAHALRVNYRCPVEVVTGAATLLGYNHRRVQKEIVSGPGNDASAGALRIVEHASDEAAATTSNLIRSWLDEPGVEPSSIAVLSRVNSLLLAPHVSLHDAGVPIRSVLTPDVLGRTGLRAALAYLRIAAKPAGFDQGDVVEILRRPTRGLPQWFPERLARRRQWTVGELAGLAGQLGDRDANKVLNLADDLRLVVEAGRAGTTRDVLEVVRDDVGLGEAMGMLDRSGGGQGSSHLDDLEGLLGVADLHPDPATFESWLTAVFQRESDPAGVTISTIHQVKGREWDRVAVFGVADGIMPHRLAEDLEEERRVLHVGITRGRHRVAVLADAGRRSAFLDELAGTAPKRSPRAPIVTRPEPERSKEPAGIAADQGLRIRYSGYTGAIEALAGFGATLRLDSGVALAVRFGERVEADGRRAPLVVPDRLWGPSAQAETALRSWRTQRAVDDGVPPYLVLNDRYLRGIAIAAPRTAAELARCEGIGPAKLEKYGDEIIAIVEALD